MIPLFSTKVHVINVLRLLKELSLNFLQSDVQDFEDKNRNRRHVRTRQTRRTEVRRKYSLHFSFLSPKNQKSSQILTTISHKTKYHR